MCWEKPGNCYKFYTSLTSSYFPLNSLTVNIKNNWGYFMFSWLLILRLQRWSILSDSLVPIGFHLCWFLFWYIFTCSLWSNYNWWENNLIASWAVFIIFPSTMSTDVVAERLRRQTANLLCSARMSSNLIHVDVKEMNPYIYSYYDALYVIFKFFFSHFLSTLDFPNSNWSDEIWLVLKI